MFWGAGPGGIGMGGMVVAVLLPLGGFFWLKPYSCPWGRSLASPPALSMLGWGWWSGWRCCILNGTQGGGPAFLPHTGGSPHPGTRAGVTLPPLPRVGLKAPKSWGSASLCTPLAISHPKDREGAAGGA